MIERIEFKNFKALRSAVLPLGRFTLIVGPNGSGKSTALKALECVRSPRDFTHAMLATAGVDEKAAVSLHFGDPNQGCRMTVGWSLPQNNDLEITDASGQPAPAVTCSAIQQTLLKTCIYALNPDQLSREVPLMPNLQLSPNGYGLAALLDSLRDTNPEQFEALKRELPRWFPEYDNILFEVPSGGNRALALRTVAGAKIAARDLSHGTLLALAMLTLSYLPDPPPLIAFEDPDRGIHPRLLREIQDALYRLAYPDSSSGQRAPVQVIATTHSPYFLDLFKEHAEEIVIAQKQGAEATFERLSERPDIEQILDGASLGDVWYSGALGGVPVAQ
ncbi:MAG TPA: AAA family ATPase [Planctomycetaceae bacterium]|nr:AAA family ATPase [Planctomycetaceae bacterium]